MKAKKIISTVLFCASLCVSGQETLTPAINTSTYHTAIGLRAGETSGITFKQFIGGHHALEAIVGAWHHGLSFTLLYEHNMPAFNVSGMNWYYGAGGHATVRTGYPVYHYYRNYRYEHYVDGSVGLGVDGIVGLEYKIPKAPIALSLDVKPYLEVISTGGFWMSLDPGLGIKLVF